MAAGSNSGIHKIGDTVAEIVADTLAGDLGLRTRNTTPADPAVGLPTLHFMTSSKARLAFTVVARGKKSFLFNLFGAQRTEKVADIRIKFEIVPSRATQAVSSDAPALFLAFPDFVDIDRPRRTLGVEIAGNRSHVLSKDGSGPLSVMLPNGQTRFFSPDEMESDTAFGLLASLAAWVRNEDNASPVRLVQPPDAGNDRIDTLLDHVATAYRKASRTIRMERTGLRGENPLSLKIGRLQDVDRQLASVHPNLAGPYRFGSLRADMLVKLDTGGRLVRKASSDDAQQFDLRTWMDPRAPDAVNISLRVSDLLCKGPVFDAFAQFLINDPEAGSRMADRVGRANLNVPGGGFLPGDSAEMDRLVRAGWAGESLYFVRLREHEGEDTEAFHVAGTYAGHAVEFVFGARMKVDAYPEVKPTELAKITLVAARIGEGRWRIFDDDGYWALILAFLERFFSILLTWRDRTAEMRQ